MRPRPVCLYKVGCAPAPVQAELGDFPAWFDRLFADHPVAMTLVDGQLEPSPEARQFAGIVITGSARSLTAPEPWMEGAIELIRGAAEAGTPVLGVCFGHQLIGAAFGGEVRRNPAGWEMSTSRVDLTPAGRADPLFAGLPDALEVNFSHQDIIDPATLAPGNGVRVLARNDKAAVQAVAAGEVVRGVQFHPEFDGAVARGYVRARWDDLRSDAQARSAAGDDPEHRLAAARDTPHAVEVFRNFVRHFVLRS